MKANKILSTELIRQLIPQARNNPRRRINYNIHTGYSEQVQRFLNVVDYDSYVRPHQHNKADAWEGFVIIRGKLGVFQFDQQGTILHRTELCETGPVFGIELDSTAAHCITSLSDQAIVFEYKEGPYDPDEDKTFSDWSPDTQSDQAIQFNQWLKSAQQGEKFTYTQKVD